MKWLAFFKIAEFFRKIQKNVKKPIDKSMLSLYN